MSVDARAVVARVLRLFAALMAIGATLSWITPRNVTGKNLMPFGCGAPASPRTSEIADFVCSDALASAKALSAGLVVSAGLLLLISEVLVPKFWPHAWARGIALAAPVAVPLMAVSTVRLLSTAGTVGADGTLVRCGTPLAPARDAISLYVCGQLADTERHLGFGGLALGAVLLIGAIYAAAAWHGGPRTSAATEPNESTGPGATSESSSHTVPSSATPNVPLPGPAGGHASGAASSTTHRWEEGR